MLRLIEERALALIPQEMNELLQDPDAPIPVKKTVWGKTDRRIHYYRGAARRPGKISISWTAESNFQDKNLLLLDASADAGLLKTDLRRGEIVVKEIQAVPRLRTVFVDGHSFSKTSMLPHPKDTKQKRLEKAELLSYLRTSITGICSMHPGGVVACATLAVRKLILDGWTKPSNLEFMHYGATKGLNWAKGYSAAIAIGCLNPSTEQVDAMSAPYLYDQENPEPMVDPVGEHTEDGDPEPAMISRLVDYRMRNGATMSLPMREPVGDIARRVYEQVRREDFVQFMGRTRPILRDEIVPFYVLGAYLPEGIVVDEVVRLQDLVAFGTPIELARHCDQALLTAADVIEPAEAIRSEALIATIRETPSIRKNLVEFDTVAGQRFVPAYATGVISRMLRDGEDIVYRPDMEPIIKPQGHSRQADLELRARERDIYDRLSTYAGMLGWESIPGSRLVEHKEQYPGRQMQASVMLQMLAWQYLPMPEEGVELYQDQLDELEAAG